MPSSRQQSGAAAESFVAVGLQDLGWELLARNLRTPYAEVDLLLRDPTGALVMVEVKARGPCSWLSAEDHLGVRQRARLLRAAEWLGNRTLEGLAARLDLALVDLLRGRPVRWQLLEDLGLD